MSLNSLTIHEAAAGLRAKKFSSQELAEACFNAMEKWESALNAFTFKNRETALKKAEKADADFAEGRAKGPLNGIPAALKDVFCTKGVRTTACSNILKNFVPPYNASVVKKLEEAGMVLLGKTNTDEFTCGASTETSCFGVTKNPWDISRVAGGSSGGSAAAVAADECLYALGTDTGGSIRQPAAFCGITGLKVTYGRVSRFGVISMASSLDTIGPMAKDVEDVAHIMNVIAGRDEFNALKEWEKAGASIKEISLPHSKYGLAVYYVICPSEVSANMARYDGIRFGPGPSSEGESLVDYYMNARGEGFGDEMKRRIMMGTYALSSGYYDAYYLKAQRVRTLVKRDFEKAFREVDVIVTPTTPGPAFKIGENAADPVKMYLEDIFTVSVNGLPIGMQIIGPQFGEEVLLKMGAAYQTVTDWHKKKPVLPIA
ncbi:aspartyl/glutamyl-tRNA amidotransferase subunit A [Candidatus Peregrinibacteria bacterium]|nr:aspartyl/glutamyl-tRNA amidotransferase subunit A [Candidatus Peregrinibacteria bacterium]